MAVLLPASGGEGFDGEDGGTASQYAEAVLQGLAVEDRPARQGNNTGLDTLVVQLDGSLHGNADLGAGGDDSEILILDLVDNVATLGGVLESGVLEVGEVLAGEREDGGGAGALQSDVVCGGRLVTVSGSPEVDVGDGAEVDTSLDRLMRGSILTETNGIVSSDPDDLMLAEGRQTDGTSSV